MYTVHIYCMRHGEKDGNVPHEVAQLTDRGRDQVRTAATLYLDKAFNNYYSSTLDRAIETAVIASLGRTNINNIIASVCLGYTEIQGDQISRRFRRAVESIAIWSAQEYGVGARVLICGHTPVIESISPSPYTSQLGLAGILRYDVSIYGDALLNQKPVAHIKDVTIIHQGV